MSGWLSRHAAWRGIQQVSAERRSRALLLIGETVIYSHKSSRRGEVVKGNVQGREYCAFSLCYKYDKILLGYYQHPLLMLHALFDFSVIETINIAC